MAMTIKVGNLEFKVNNAEEVNAALTKKLEEINKELADIMTKVNVLKSQKKQLTKHLKKSTNA